MHWRERIKPSTTLALGLIGLTADIITIIGTIAAAHISPTISGLVIVKPALDVIVLFTALLADLSLKFSA